jgi:hypothetical protein
MDSKFLKYSTIYIQYIFLMCCMIEVKTKICIENIITKCEYLIHMFFRRL